MKQNSSILFHTMPKSLRNRDRLTVAAVAISLAVCLFGNTAAADKPEYLNSSDPEKAFASGRRDLRAIFLQIGGSLESYSSPLPYLRHVASEHDRIVRLYAEKYHRTPRITRPAYLDDAYLDRLAGNWDLLGPKLGLGDFSKAIGRLIRQSIEEAPDSTAIASIFAEDEKQTASQDLASRLADLGRSSATSSKNPDRQAEPSAAGQIQNLTDQLFSRIDKVLNPRDAERVKTVLKSIFADVTRMAEVELEEVIAESTPPYSADLELALNPEEQKQLAAFLTKERFTRSDFDLLDRFYSGPYKRISERGKDELSRRVWNGARAAKEAKP